MSDTLVGRLRDFYNRETVTTALEAADRIEELQQQLASLHPSGCIYCKGQGSHTLMCMEDKTETEQPCMSCNGTRKIPATHVIVPLEALELIRIMSHDSVEYDDIEKAGEIALRIKAAQETDDG